MKKPQFNSRLRSIVVALSASIGAHCCWADVPDDGGLIPTSDDGGPETPEPPNRVIVYPCPDGSAVCEDGYYNKEQEGWMLGSSTWVGSNSSSPGQGTRDGSGGGAPAKTPNKNAPTAGDKNTAPDNPCEGGTPAANPESGNPVIIATGEKYQTEPDFAGSGLYPLAMTRTYRSSLQSTGMFGPGWLSTYDVLPIYANNIGLDCTGGGGGPIQNVAIANGVATPATQTCVPKSVTITFPDGSQFSYYHKINTSYYYPVNGASGPGVMLHAAGQNWTLMKGAWTYIFNSGGYISQIVALNGLVTQSYSYSGIGQVGTVTNAAGQSLKFTWTNGRVTQILDPSNNAWTYGYDGNGHLSSVTSPNPAAHTRQYLYESATNNGWLTGIVVDGIRYSTYSYNSNGTVATSGRTNGEENDVFAYGTNSTTITDVRGEPTTYNYTQVNGVLKLSSVSRAATSSCASGVAKTSYDANGYAYFTLDWNGNGTNYNYSSTGILGQVTRAAGTNVAQTTAYTWYYDQPQSATYSGSDGKVYKSVVYSNFTTANAPSPWAVGKLQSEVWTDAISRATRQIQYAYTFYSNGTLATKSRTLVLSSGNATTTVSYDILGNISNIVNPLGQSTSYSGYNGLGRPGRKIDVNNVSTDYSYDGGGNALEIVQHFSTGDNTNYFSYNGFGSVLTASSSDGSSITLAYNSANRLISKVNALGETVTFNHDIPTNTDTVTSSRNIPSWTGSAYTATSGGTFSISTKNDSLNRPWVQKGNSGQQVVVSYDGNGNVLSATDALSHAVVVGYDSLDNVATQAFPDGGLAKFSYGVDGRLNGVTTPRKLSTTYSNDGFGNVLTIRSPDAGLTTNTYDNFGRLSGASKADGIKITYAYDALNRRTSRTSMSATETWSYDQGSNGKGHLTALSDVTGQTNYGYDGAGNLTSLAATVYGQSLGMGWSYTQAGHVRSMNYPDGVVVNYNYDSYGRVSSITSSLGGSMILSSVLYQPASQVPYAWQFGNGVWRATTIDADSRVTEIKSAGAQDLVFSYNIDNSIYGISDTLWGNNQALAYDANGRLTQGANSSQSYDVDGNRLTSSVNGVSTAYTMDPASNRLISASSRAFSYTGSGSLYTDNSRSFSTDEFGRIAAVTVAGQNIGSYRYNALSQRVYKATAAGTDYFVYDLAGNLMAQAGATPTDYIWFNGTIVGFIRSGKFYSIHTDQVGRPEEALDQTGVVVWRAKNNPFDRIVQLSSVVGGLNIGFPGQYYDSETNLWYNLNRFYDASIGRYIQTDATGMQGGFNSYAYAGGKPNRYVDPRGHELVLAAIGGTIGAVWGGVNGYMSGDRGSALAIDIGAGAGTGALAGLTNGLSLAEVAAGVATRATISAGIESYRQMAVGALPCHSVNISAKNIALAGAFSVAGDLTAMVTSPVLRSGMMPMTDDARGAFWGGNFSGAAGTPFATLDGMSEGSGK